MASKTFKDNLNKKLEGLKGAWVDELPLVPWARHKTTKTTMRKTLFTLAFGTKVVILAKVEIPSYRIEAFDETRMNKNKEDLLVNLDLLDE